jgi:hypothetical protein
VRQTAYPSPVRTGAVIALLAVVTMAAGLAFWAGARAGGVTPPARPVPDVVGLSLPEARRALGDARLLVVRVAWAPPGIVARVIGLQFDGRYLAGTRLTLDAGRRPG